MITSLISQADDSGLRNLPEPTRNGLFSALFRMDPLSFTTPSGRKSHGIMEAVFRTDSIVPGNGKIRQVTFAAFYPEGRGIRAGNPSEINVSLRNLAGKVRIAAGCQLKIPLSERRC